MVTVAWLNKVFRIFPEWLMWSISWVNGHLKGYRSQSKSWRSHGVAHEVHQKAPKCTKMHQNGHHLMTMTEQSVLNLSWVTDRIHFWIKQTLETGYKSEPVMEASWGCTWGVPKCNEMTHNGPYSVTEQSLTNFSWVTIVIHFWTDWTLERE